MQSAAVLEGLELVELERAADPATQASVLESSSVEVAAVSAEEIQPMRNGSPRAAEIARTLTVRRLGDEVAEEIEVQMRLAQTVVNSKGLDRESASALEAQEALDEAAVAAAVEEALASPTEKTRALRDAIRVRTTPRLKLHEVLPK